jgi:hypothetical protein
VMLRDWPRLAHTEVPGGKVFFTKRISWSD